MFTLLPNDSHRLRFLAFMSIAAVLCVNPVLAASLPNALLQNSRVSLDFSSRGLRVGSDGWSLQALGIDFHTVVTSESGDLGTFVFQSYLLRIDNPPGVPELFDDEHDWALKWRIVNFNYTGIGRGGFNLRLGHFETPFGLEQVIQTNGTLRQVNAPTGLKTDWGVSVNGRLPTFEYEFAYMLGSGNEWDIDEKGVVVGRIGLPSDKNWWAGISFLDGTIQSSAGSRPRELKSIDAGIRLPYGFTFLAEQVSGRENGETLKRSFAELSWLNASESSHWFLQWRNTLSVKDGASGSVKAPLVSIGLRYEPNRHWSMSVKLDRNYESSHTDQYIAQIRYRT